MPKPAHRNNTPSALEQAGLMDRLYQADTLKLEELRDVTYVRVHSLENSPLSADSGFRLPEDTGQCGGENPEILCLRPGDWLFTSLSSGVDELLERLAEETDFTQTAILNASDSLATFRLAGSAAPWLLSKLSGLDFLAGNSRASHCARTKIGHVGAIVHYHQHNDNAFVFDLIVDRSLAKYLWLLLTESAGHAEELTKIYGG